MITFHCSSCQRELKVDDATAGKRGKCPYCATKLVVPLASQPAKAPVKQEAEAASFASLLPPPKAQDHEEWIDMTAMVDIVFFLLIFFLVTSLKPKQAAIEVPVPEARQKAEKGVNSGQKSVADFEKDSDFVIVRIDSDDTIWVDDAMVPSQQELSSRLRAAMHGEAGAPGAHRMLVLANSDALYGTAVMVLDTGSEVGMEENRLAVVDEN